MSAIPSNRKARILRALVASGPSAFSGMTICAHVGLLRDLGLVGICAEIPTIGGGFQPLKTRVYEITEAGRAWLERFEGNGLKSEVAK